MWPALLRIHPWPAHPIVAGIVSTLQCMSVALLTCPTCPQVLDLAAALYPVWASCGCRLAAPELLTAMMHTYTHVSREAAAAQAEGSAKGKGGGGRSSSGGARAGAPAALSPAEVGSGAAAALVPTPAEAAQACGLLACCV